MSKTLYFFAGLTIWVFLWVLLCIWEALAFDFDLIPTTEQADRVFELQMEYQNTIQQTIAEARHFKNNRSNCTLEDAYFILNWEKVACDGVIDHFRTRYAQIVDLGVELSGVCDEYFWVNGAMCDLFVEKYRS